jgi:Zn-dependent protease with chaperone function
MDQNSPESKQLILYNLRSREYEHTLDRKALEALQNTMGFDKLMRWINEHGIELYYKTIHTGSSVKVTPKMYPELYKLLQTVCSTLHLQPVPDMYVKEGADINAFAIGSENPIIVLNTQTIKVMTELELKYIVGHEVGHIKSNHVLYQMIASLILPSLGEIIGNATLGIGNLFTSAIEGALMSWSRLSEYTADRAGLLACQDIDAAIKANMKLSGVPECHYEDLDPEQFLIQAAEFKGFDESKWHTIIKFISGMGSTHPWTVMRAHELDLWIKKGEYQKLLDHRATFEPPQEIVCGHCGNKLVTSAKFCSGCGTRIAIANVEGIKIQES